MQLKDIIAISGMGGLHHIIGRRPTGLIVETIDEQKKRFPTNFSQKVSVLEDISIYTVEGEASLRDVLLSIHEKEAKGLTIPDKKAGDQELRSFLKEVLPEFDESRVYVSDIKKLVGWYKVINKDLDWEALKTPAATESADAGSGEEKGEAKETKKAAKKPAKTVEKKIAAPRAANIKSKTNTPRKTGGA